MTSIKVSTVHHIPNSNIVIDYWNPEPTKTRLIRFMTLIRIGSKHLNQIRQSSYTFYTSEVNKWILQKCFEIPESRIIAIGPNQSCEILDDNDAKGNIDVTLFDANYCVGSCMFLFRGSFGNVLWTGYFRPYADWGAFEVPVLKSLIENKNVNVVYIDNSYAAEHCEFPKRAEVVKDVVSLIRTHPNHKVIIAGKPLGKEEVLVDIAKTFDIQICVPVEKYEFLTQLKSEKHFTTDCTASRVSTDEHLTSWKVIKERQSREGQCLVILLTAWYKFAKESPAVSAAWNIPGLHILPYSSHCCHSELVEFLSILRPHKIEPIINEKTSQNVVIPKSLHDLCYNPSLSCPLVDSDWDYLTCSNVDSAALKYLQHDSPLLSESLNIDNMLIPDVSDHESTSMDLCQSMLENASKSCENNSHTADEDFMDAVNGEENFFIKNENLESNQTNDSDYEDFENPIESINDTSLPNTCFEGDDSSVLEEARTEISEVRTPGNRSPLECSNTSLQSCDISLEMDCSPEGNSSQYLQDVTESSLWDSENSLTNDPPITGESSEQNQSNMFEELDHDETKNSVLKSLDCTENSCETDLPSNEGIHEPEYLSNDAQDSVEVIQASDPIYTPTEIHESDTGSDSDADTAREGQKRELESGQVSPRRLRSYYGSASVSVVPDSQTVNAEQLETVERMILRSSCAKISVCHIDSPGIHESERSLITMTEEDITDLHNRLFLIYSMSDPKPEDPYWLSDAWKDAASYEWHNDVPSKL